MHLLLLVELPVWSAKDYVCGGMGHAARGNQSSYSLEPVSSQLLDGARDEQRGVPAV